MKSIVLVLIVCLTLVYMNDSWQKQPPRIRVNHHFYLEKILDRLCPTIEYPRYGRDCDPADR